MAVFRGQHFWCLMHLTISLMLVVLDAFYRNSAWAQGLLDKSLGASGSVILSQVSNPIPPKPPQQPIPIPQPPPEPPLELPSPTLSESFERPNIPGTITVARFEFDGNTAFSDEKLTEVTAKFTKRLLTFASLLQAEAVVTKLYTDAGYINSGAVIPSGQT